MIGLRVLTIILSGLAVIFIYKLGKKLFSPEAGFIAALIFSVFSANSYVFNGNSAQAETWMPATTVLGFYLFFVAREKKSWLILFASGLSLGISFLYKQSALYNFIPLLLFSLGQEFLNLRNKKNVFNLRSLGLPQLPLILGFVLPMGIFVFYIVLIGKLAFLWDWMVVKTRIYSDIKEPHQFNYIKTTLGKISPIAIIAFLEIIITVFRREGRRVIFVLWLIFTPLVFITSGKFWNYYFLQLFIPLSFLAGMFIGDLLLLRKKMIAALLLLDTALILFIFNIDYYSRSFYNYSSFLKGQIRKEDYINFLAEGDFRRERWSSIFETAEFLKQNSQPEKTFLIMDGSPGIYVLSDKWPVYKEFLYKQQFFENKTIGFTFMHSFETYEGNRRKLLEKLASSPPTFIVLAVDSPMSVFDEVREFPHFFLLCLLIMILSKTMEISGFISLKVGRKFFLEI